jgi:hypothetical protein
MKAQADALVSKSERVRVGIMLVDHRDATEQREAVLAYREMPDGSRQAAVAFSEPARIRGTALVVWHGADGEKQQWLFMPAVQKYQRVAGGARRSAFMGTDFTFEDLEPEDLDAYDYSFLPEQELDGEACYVIEARPKTDEVAKGSSYARRVLYVRKDIKIPVKIEFYDRRDALVKTQENSNLTQTPEGYWRPERSVMENHRNRHRTLMAVLEREVDIELDPELFTEKSVRDGRLLK